MQPRLSSTLVILLPYFANKMGSQPLVPSFLSTLEVTPASYKWGPDVRVEQPGRNRKGRELVGEAHWFPQCSQ